MERIPHLPIGAKVRVMQTDAMAQARLANLTGRVEGMAANGSALVRLDSSGKGAVLPLSLLIETGKKKLRGTQPAKVACPACGEKQESRGPDAEYRCPSCGGLFDSDPDEGGSHLDDPSKRLERQEGGR